MKRKYYSWEECINLREVKVSFISSLTSLTTNGNCLFYLRSHLHAVRSAKAPQFWCLSFLLEPHGGTSHIGLVIGQAQIDWTAVQLIGRLFIWSLTTHMKSTRKLIFNCKGHHTISFFICSSHISLFHILILVSMSVSMSIWNHYEFGLIAQLVKALHWYCRSRGFESHFTL